MVDPPDEWNNLSFFENDRRNRNVSFLPYRKSQVGQEHCQILAVYVIPSCVIVAQVQVTGDAKCLFDCGFSEAFIVPVFVGTGCEWNLPIDVRTNTVSPDAPISDVYTYDFSEVWSNGRWCNQEPRFAMASISIETTKGQSERKNVLKVRRYRHGYLLY